MRFQFPNNSSEEAASWTFKWQQDDLYKMAGTIYTRDEEGKQVYSGTKYLKIDSNGFSMVDNAEDASDIQVVPGTGIHAGQMIKVDDLTQINLLQLKPMMDYAKKTGKPFLSDTTGYLMHIENEDGRLVCHFRIRACIEANDIRSLT